MRIRQPLVEVIFPTLRRCAHVALGIGEDRSNLALFLLDFCGGEQVRVGGIEGGGAGNRGFGDKPMAIDRRLLRQRFMNLVFGLAGGHQL
ncbi:hypothetical protein D3C71_1385420 [compost metagenome]